MININNPVIASLREAISSNSTEKEYTIETSSFGRYAIKDTYGILHGTFTDQESAKNKLNELRGINANNKHSKYSILLENILHNSRNFIKRIIGKPFFH